MIPTAFFSKFKTKHKKSPLTIQCLLLMISQLAVCRAVSVLSWARSFPWEPGQRCWSECASCQCYSLPGCGRPWEALLDGRTHRAPSDWRRCQDRFHCHRGYWTREGSPVGMTSSRSSTGWDHWSQGLQSALKCEARYCGEKMLIKL